MSGLVRYGVFVVVLLVVVAAVAAVRESSRSEGSSRGEG